MLFVTLQKNEAPDMIFVLANCSHHIRDNTTCTAEYKTLSLTLNSITKRNELTPKVARLFAGQVQHVTFFIHFYFQSRGDHRKAPKCGPSFPRRPTLIANPMTAPTSTPTVIASTR